MVKETTCPLESIEHTLALASIDWSLNKNNAWLWGITCGWDDDCLRELSDRFGWSTKTVERLKELHKSFNKLKIQQLL